MTLRKFIHENHAAIIREWEVFAKTMEPAALGMDRSALRDHIKQILEAIAKDLDTAQDDRQQAEKSKGRGATHAMQAVGTAHAVLRIEAGFKLDQLVAEYRALRATVLRLFADASRNEPTGAAEFHELTRFNESIDEALVEAADRYVKAMQRTRDQFLAILGHDLRNPLGAILMSAASISARGPEERIAKASARIFTSAERMKRMVNDLLDLTRTQLGSGIPVRPKPMDLATLCSEVVAETLAFHPDRTIELEREGDLHGSWDRDRLSQVLSNLLGNALQHGDPSSKVRVRARDDGEHVLLEVHNDGRPIPPRMQATIFDPLVRDAEGHGASGLTSLGLGLHIVREVALAHGGTADVKSSAEAGSTFSVRLPRQPPRSALDADAGVPAVH